MAVDTIVALSTPPGRSGIGVVRLSGPAAGSIAGRLAGPVPAPRVAAFRTFRQPDGTAIDEGLVLHFPAPASFTGEDVTEFHAHGSVAVLGALVEASRACGARDARPGEFTERAFLNGKIDLAQAEAVADLIEARTTRAARAALRTLRGAFSRDVNALVETLHGTHAALEATIDFPDDLDESEHATQLHAALTGVRDTLDRLLAGGARGARLCAGATVAIAGAPNVGKSTLLNALLGEDAAIVSPVPGTTRDVVATETIIAGLPVRLSDTAGLRDGGDAIEREGMRRAERVVEGADLVLEVVAPDVEARGPEPAIDPARAIVVENKIDLRGEPAGVARRDGRVVCRVSALTGAGIDALRELVAERLGAQDTDENEFLARERHLAALEAARLALVVVDEPLLTHSPELAAERCREASRALEAITGEYGAEDLLGEIFARFCIGK